jgi:hypothetical protein
VLVKKSTYRIDYSPEAVDHLAGVTALQSTTVLDVVARNRVQIGGEEVEL